MKCLHQIKLTYPMENGIWQKNIIDFIRKIYYRALASELMVLNNIKLYIVFNYLLWAYSKAKSSTSIK